MKKNTKGAAQAPNMTGKDSTAVRKAIKTNLPYEAHSSKTGRANPSNYSYHHDRFVYSDGSRNASGIGSGGTVRGGDAALTSYNRYKTDKETAATALKNLTSKFGSTAISGIREEMTFGPKPKAKSDGKPKDFYITTDPDNTRKHGERVTGLNQGAPQIARGLRHLDPQVLHLAAAAHYGKDTSPNFGMDLPKMEAGDDSYEKSGGGVFNMTPNVSEEEAKKVRDKFDTTYMKSGSPKMINKLRNIGK